MLIQATREMLRERPSHGWLIAKDGCSKQLTELASRFRNPASHDGLLGEDDYRQCFEKVVGAQGVLWELVVATRTR